MELLSNLASNYEDVLEVGREADRRTTAFASTPNSSPAVAIRSRLTRTPYVADVLVEEIVRTTDSVRFEPGLPRGVRRTGKVRSVRIPVYDRFESTLEQALPYAWTIRAEQAALIEPLQRHGVFVEQVDQPTSVRAERFRIDSLIQSPTRFQGHQEVRLGGRWERTDSLVLESGTYVVRAAQPLGIMALYLLEPQTDDGLVTWNALDQWLGSGQYPIARIVDRITVPLRGIR
jgi:hypothetical protein